MSVVVRSRSRDVDALARSLPLWSVWNPFPVPAECGVCNDLEEPACATTMPTALGQIDRVMESGFGSTLHAIHKRGFGFLYPWG